MALTGQAGILQLHPSRRCNLRCRHCYSSSGPWVPDTTDLDVLRRIVTAAPGLGYDVLAVSGGEPLLFPHLRPILELARELGMRTTVTTNGLLLTPRRLAELQGLVDVLAISVDGQPGSHDWLRGDDRAFTRMESRLPSVRDSGIAFGFITTLTMRNVAELEFVFEFAKQWGASLVQVHPLEPDGSAADMGTEVPDSTELGFAFFEATRLSLVHGVPVQVDLVTQKDLRSSPERFLVRSPEASMPLGRWLSPLVMETDATVVPLSYGFGRSYALGSLHEASLDELARQWDPEPLRRLAVHLHTSLVRDEVTFSNWYERMLRLSLTAPVTSSGTPAAHEHLTVS